LQNREGLLLPKNPKEKNSKEKNSKEKPAFPGRECRLEVKVI
jgi:hypothetical protein